MDHPGTCSSRRRHAVVATLRRRSNRGPSTSCTKSRTKWNQLCVGTSCRSAYPLGLAGRVQPPGTRPAWAGTKRRPRSSGGPSLSVDAPTDRAPPRTSKMRQGAAQLDAILLVGESRFNFTNQENVFDLAARQSTRSRRGSLRAVVARPH